MANHCIEATCIECGTTYCLRGCGGDPRPDPEAARLLQEQIKAGIKMPMPIDNPKCPACGGIGHL